MSDRSPNPTLSTTKARSHLATAHMGGEPDPAIEQILRGDLACSNLDRKIRIELAKAKLHPVHVGHLVGLLLMESGVDGSTVLLIEKLARDAAEAVQNGGERR